LDQAALHVAFAIDMACSLIPLTADADLPAPASIACLESYHSHMRTLIEFFLRPRQRRDIHRHDFLPCWEADTGYDGVRLQELWEETSQNVSHLSWKRAPVPGEGIMYSNVAPHNLAVIAGLMLSVVASFVGALEEAIHPNAAQFRAALNLGYARLRGEDGQAQTSS
jgi:hypothetical protein